MPAKILPDNKMRQWVREGKTNAEIVRLLDTREHITITRQAVSVWKRRAGLDVKPEPPRRLPWKVREEHRQMSAARVIRNWVRMESGEDIPEVEARRVTYALNELAKVADEREWKHGAVFHYDGDTEEGWFVVARRPGVDTGIYRVPDTQR